MCSKMSSMRDPSGDYSHHRAARRKNRERALRMPRSAAQRGCRTGVHGTRNKYSIFTARTLRSRSSSMRQNRGRARQLDVGHSREVLRCEIFQLADICSHNLVEERTMRAAKIKGEQFLDAAL